MTHPARHLVGLLALLVVALEPPSAHAQKDDEVFPMAPVEVTSPWVVVPPSVKAAPKPPYPEGARSRDQQGAVSLLIRVRADGTVGEVKVRKSSGHATLDEAATAGARAWTFVPARRGPTPIEAWVEVPVEFKLY
jgi:protein TonB